MILVRQLTEDMCVFGYSGLNFQDLMVRQGAIDSPPKTPFILGFECAGEVEEIGEGVTDFKVSHSHVLFLH
jgi:NADPH:quinone reductase-like Zn-dependent oxidoreductase